MVLLEELRPETVVDHVDAAAARRALREQIARLERLLGEALVEAFPLTLVEPAAADDAGLRGAASGPRLLTLGELEHERDGLQERLRDVRAELEAHGAEVEQNRILLERMLLQPRRHKFVTLRAADVGMGGCGAYHVRPRLGIIGMLLGWWHVKLSSGCPLATSHGTP
jgi:hypothetical protein